MSSVATHTAPTNHRHILAAANASPSQAEVLRKLQIVETAIVQLEEDIQATRNRHALKQSELRCLLLKSLQQQQNQSLEHEGTPEQRKPSRASTSILTSIARKSVTFSSQPLDIRLPDEAAADVPAANPTAVTSSASSVPVSSLPPGTEEQRSGVTCAALTSVAASQQVVAAVSPNIEAASDADRVDNQNSKKRARTASTQRRFALVIDGPVGGARARDPYPEVKKSNPQPLLPRRRLHLAMDTSSPPLRSPMSGDARGALTCATPTSSASASTPTSRAHCRVATDDLWAATPSRRLELNQRPSLSTRDPNVTPSAKPWSTPTSSSSSIQGLGHNNGAMSTWPEAFSSGTEAGTQLLSAMVAARRALARSSIVLAGGETEFLDLDE